MEPRNVVNLKVKKQQPHIKSVLIDYNILI